jgi:hypothetical protein
MGWGERWTTVVRAGNWGDVAVVECRDSHRGRREYRAGVVHRHRRRSSTRPTTPLSGNVRQGYHQNYAVILGQPSLRSASRKVLDTSRLQVFTESRLVGNANRPAGVGLWLPDAFRHQGEPIHAPVHFGIRCAFLEGVPAEPPLDSSCPGCIGCPARLGDDGLRIE